MRRVTLSRLAVGLLAFLAIGCGATSPSASVPSMATPAVPRATVLPDLTPASSPTPVPGATDGAEDGVFRIELGQPDGSGRLLVVLTDLTGLVVGIEAGPPDIVVMEAGVLNPVGVPTVLTYGWVGGACDTLTSITFERANGGFRLVNTTKTTGDMCILIALDRVVDIRLSQQVDADNVIVADR